MMDLEHVVFVWQGWWPEVDETNDNVETGSAHARFNKERQLALETTIQYCKSEMRFDENLVKLFWSKNVSG